MAKPVRPVWETGETGSGLDSREELNPRDNSNLPPIDFPIHSTDQSETLGIVGVPCGLPLARSSVPETHSIKRNQKSTLENTSNPRTPKTPKSSPLTHEFGRGIKGKRTTKGSHEFPLIKSPRARNRRHTEKTTKRGLRKSPPRTTGNNTTKP
jgi:hypothetical protein